MTLLLCLFVIQIKPTNFLKENLTVKNIDKQGMFVGDREKVFTEKPKQIYQEIDYVWEQVRMAGISEKQGKLVEAAEYYKKGFRGLSSDMENITPERSMCATYLIDIYQELGRYNEALELLNILETKVFKGKFGAKRAAEIRSRLLAEKAQNEKN